MTQGSKEFKQKLLELLKEQSKREEYINPNFLSIIQQALLDYGGYEDVEVDKWIKEMWGR